MDLELDGKVIVITGAAGLKGSIGQQMLMDFTVEGAKLAIIDRNDRGLVYAEELTAQGHETLFVKTDVTVPSEIESAIVRIVSHFGKIDIVVNNVGVNDGIGLDGSYEDFMDSLKLNLVSYWLTVKFALPELRKSKGVILNIGSKVGFTGQGGTSAYAASKGGVLALTREWAVDLIPDGIRVNAIIIAESWTPAYDHWIKSLKNGEEKLTSIVSKIPLENRMTSPKEISNTALFLVSSKSSHTTGQFVFVDGGYVHLDRSLLSVSI